MITSLRVKTLALYIYFEEEERMLNPLLCDLSEFGGPGRQCKDRTGMERE